MHKHAGPPNDAPPRGRPANAATDGPRHRIPGTLLIGLGLILASQVLLMVDLVLRGGAMVPIDTLPQPEGALGWIARQAAINMTTLCWIGVLLSLDGLLTFLAARRAGIAGSPVRRRPRRFLFCFLISIPIWLSFDWFNFSFLHAWDYHELPEHILHRYTGYFFAFGAISPAMFLFAQLYQELGWKRVIARPWRIGRRWDVALMVLGAGALVFPLLVRDPSGTLTLWLGWWLILDPLNRRLGAPSLLADWHSGRWGRTLSLMAAGATCGFLWEFWNYWAVAKWTYDLPFLGPAEALRYFEMPVPGLLGFLPFAPECWAMFQTSLLVLQKCGLPLKEAPPDDDSLL